MGVKRLPRRRFIDISQHDTKARHLWVTSPKLAGQLKECTNKKAMSDKIALVIKTKLSYRLTQMVARGSDSSSPVALLILFTLAKLPRLGDENN